MRHSFNTQPVLCLSGSPPRSPKDGVLVLPGVDPQNLSVQIRRLFKRLGIAGSFHTLRHTAASWLAMTGTDLYVIGGIREHELIDLVIKVRHIPRASDANQFSTSGWCLIGAQENQ